MNYMHLLIFIALIPLTIVPQGSHGAESRGNVTPSHAAETDKMHLGIIGASGGDIESCQELHSFVTNFASEAVWNSVKDRLISEYQTLPDCNTHFRGRGRAQTAAIAIALQAALPNVTISSYAGFRFVYGNGVPADQTLLDALAQAQQDGVTDLFITDQDDILFSKLMQQRGYDQITDYLNQHPEWNVRVLGLNGYSEQPGFVDLLVENLRGSVIRAFPNVPDADIGIVLPCQGIRQINEESDPHASRARALAQKVQAAMPQYSIFLTFQNAQEKPGDLQTYSQPSEQTMLPSIATHSRQHILISPNLQWPITDISVLWRQPVQYRDKIRAIAPAKQIASELAWDASPSFANFAATILADIVLNSAAFKYDTTVIHGGLAKR